MNTVILPALRGDSPFAFMAALGAARLLAEAGHEPRLSWAGYLDPPQYVATLHGPWADAADVATDLAAVVNAIPPGQVIPGVADWPSTAPLAAGHDPSLPMTNGWLDAGNDLAGMWMRSVAGPDGSPSPYVARRGKQSIRTLFDQPLRAIRTRPADAILDALTVGTRVNGCTGEGLDYNAPVTAADAQDGKATSQSIPGQAWLAVMALPLLSSRCWYPARAGIQMAYPLWHPPLDLAAIDALLDHPAVSPVADSPGAPEWTVEPNALTTLGVIAVFGAHWQWRDKYSRVLTPGPHPTMRTTEPGRERW